MQQRSIAALAAKGDMAAPRHMQQLHPAHGEGLRRSHGPWCRQLQYQIGAAADGHLPTGVLARHGGVAPLDEVAAHGAYKGGVVLPPQALQHPGVAQMKGIVFAYDTNGVHNFPP